MHILTQSALLRALGWSLFNSLWQMSLLWAFYHLFLLVFNNISARTRHGLALLLLTAGFIWSAGSFVAAYFFQGSLGSSASMAPAAGGLLSALLDLTRGMASTILPWCSSLYLLTLAGLSVHYTRQYIRCRRIVREGLSPLPPEFGAFVTTAVHRMGIGATVRAHLSSMVEIPMTMGFWKPVILLPISMVTQLTTVQIEAILVHELAHIRRKDYLLNWLVTVMELLYFFNPFTRLLIAQVKKEREHCCDDAVLEFRYDPHSYVSALLSLARQQQQPRLAIAAIGGGEQLLLQRARKILQQKRADDRPGPRPLIGFVLTALVSMLVLGHSRPARTDRPILRQLVLRQQTRYTETMPVVLLNDGPVPAKDGPAVAKEGSVLAKSAAPPPAAHRHPVAHHTTHRRQDPTDDMPGQSVLVLNTSGPADAPTIAVAKLMEAAHRDFSITDQSQGNNELVVYQKMIAANTPFVPQSSFSFSYTDTLPPAQKLALMQEFTEKVLQTQLISLQDEIRQQQLLLNQRKDSQLIDPKELELRKQYLLKLEMLQQQLQKAARRLKIVYI